MGLIVPSEDTWYTHPDLEELYRNRQTPPASWDSTALGLVTPVKNQVLLSCQLGFSWYNIPKRGKILKIPQNYQITITYTTRPKNIPNGHKQY
jgi:hypothetical protein